MAHDAEWTRDLGRCQQCGGPIAATHMLTKSYEVKEDGRWQRRLGDFVEDVIVVCVACGDEPQGRFETDGVEFTFIPAR